MATVWHKTHIAHVHSLLAAATAKPTVPESVDTLKPTLATEQRVVTQQHKSREMQEGNCNQTNDRIIKYVTHSYRLTNVYTHIISLEVH